MHILFELYYLFQNNTLKATGLLGLRDLDNDHIYLFIHIQLNTILLPVQIKRALHFYASMTET